VLFKESFDDAYNQLFIFIQQQQMKKLFHISLQLFLLVLLLDSCKKEGVQGPQGPQGPAGNPGASSSGGGDSTNGSVRAYLFTEKPLVWQYFTAGGSCWLTYQGYPYEPQDLVYYINDVKNEDVVLTYLQLASGAGTFWAPLPYTFQQGSPVRTETYRVLTKVNDEDIYRFRVRADLVTVKVPYYKVQGMRVVVIPGNEAGVIGGRLAKSLEQMSLEEVMEKYQLQEKDFKKMQ
jgi:hypothetical protein